MTVKPYQRRWLSYLVGMIALAVVMSALFPARPAAPSDTPAAAPADLASDPLRYEVNVGTQWHTSDITSMYMGRWFTAPMTYTIIDGGEGVGPIAITQGDIALNLNSITTAGSAVNRTSLLWPGGIVPWDFAPNFPAQYRVFDAIAHWEEKTSIRFVQRTPENADKYPNWVRFTPSMGCWSYVGMQGGMQFIGLAAGCSTGSTIHEIGHALGLWHEQSRIDRDDYVTIYFENIIAGMAHNFAKHVNDGQDLGPYDYDSIMHYPRWAFSKNGKDTIVPKIDVEIGQRSTLSEGDIAAIETLYGR